MGHQEQPQLDIALVNRICPVCAKPADSEILIDTRMRKDTPLHDKMHGKTVGIAHMCDACRKALDDSDPTGIYLVEYDASKTSQEDAKDNNPWRTGLLLAVTPAAFMEWFKVPVPESQVAYLEFPIVKGILEQHNKLTDNEKRTQREGTVDVPSTDDKQPG